MTKTHFVGTLDAFRKTHFVTEIFVKLLKSWNEMDFIRKAMVIDVIFAPSFVFL